MHNIVGRFCCFLLAWAALYVVCQAPAARAGALDDPRLPPLDWSGSRFVPNFAYRERLVSLQAKPWHSIDFKKQPRAYLGSLLDYALRGQSIATWHPSDNKVRAWHHAPWLGPGVFGREFIAGLTRGKDSKPGELGEQQQTCWQNWGLVLFNGEAGYSLGQVWRPVISDKGGPDLSKLPFVPGSVILKLQFSEASVAEVAHLRGAPTLTANVHKRYRPGDRSCAPFAERTPKTMRLLQIDIAVRDPRADHFTGWVFASYGFDGRRPGRGLADKLEPLGLTWGSDPQLSDEKAAGGAKPVESIVLSDFGLGRPLGRGGRMNGPIDSPKSACIACHATAQWPNEASLTPPEDAGWDLVRCWFRNLKAQEAFGREPSSLSACGSHPPGKRLRSTDYSFVVAIGIRNWTHAQGLASGSKDAKAVSLGPMEVDGMTSRPMRRGGR